MSNEARGVVIFDQEYQDAARKISSYCEELISMIDSYAVCLQTITQTAIKDQRISSRLSKVAEKVTALREPVQETANLVSQNCAEYISEIDSADQFLY